MRENLLQDTIFLERDRYSLGHQLSFLGGERLDLRLTNGSGVCEPAGSKRGQVGQSDECPRAAYTVLCARVVSGYGRNPMGQTILSLVALDFGISKVLSRSIELS